MQYHNHVQSYIYSPSLKENVGGNNKMKTDVCRRVSPCSRNATLSQSQPLRHPNLPTHSRCFSSTVFNNIDKKDKNFIKTEYHDTNIINHKNNNTSKPYPVINWYLPPATSTEPINLTNDTKAVNRMYTAKHSNATNRIYTTNCTSPINRTIPVGSTSTFATGRTCTPPFVEKRNETAEVYNCEAYTLNNYLNYNVAKKQVSYKTNICCNTNSNNKKRLEMVKKSYHVSPSPSIILNKGNLNSYIKEGPYKKRNVKTNVLCISQLAKNGQLKTREMQKRNENCCNKPKQNNNSLLKTATTYLASRIKPSVVNETKVYNGTHKNNNNVNIINNNNINYNNNINNNNNNNINYNNNINNYIRFENSLKKIPNNFIAEKEKKCAFREYSELNSPIFPKVSRKTSVKEKEQLRHFTTNCRTYKIEPNYPKENRHINVNTVATNYHQCNNTDYKDACNGANEETLLPMKYKQANNDLLPKLVHLNGNNIMMSNSSKAKQYVGEVDVPYVGTLSVKKNDQESVFFVDANNKMAKMVTVEGIKTTQECSKNASQEIRDVCIKIKNQHFQDFQVVEEEAQKNKNKSKGNEEKKLKEEGQEKRNDKDVVHKEEGNKKNNRDVINFTNYYQKNEDENEYENTDSEDYNLSSASEAEVQKMQEQSRPYFSDSLYESNFTSHIAYFTQREKNTAKKIIEDNNIDSFKIDTVGQNKKTKTENKDPAFTVSVKKEKGKLLNSSSTPQICKRNDNKLEHKKMMLNTKNISDVVKLEKDGEKTEKSHEMLININKMNDMLNKAVLHCEKKIQKNKQHKNDSFRSNDSPGEKNGSNVNDSGLHWDTENILKCKRNMSVNTSDVRPYNEHTLPKSSSFITRSSSSSCISHGNIVVHSNKYVIDGSNKDSQKTIKELFCDEIEEENIQVSKADEKKEEDNETEDNLCFEKEFGEHHIQELLKVLTRIKKMEHRKHNTNEMITIKNDKSHVSYYTQYERGKRDEQQQQIQNVSAKSRGFSNHTTKWSKKEDANFIGEVGSVQDQPRINTNRTKGKTSIIQNNTQKEILRYGANNNNNKNNNNNILSGSSNCRSFFTKNQLLNSKTHGASANFLYGRKKSSSVDVGKKRIGKGHIVTNENEEPIEHLKERLKTVDLELDDLVYLKNFSNLFWFLYLKSRFKKRTNIIEFCEELKEQINRISHINKYKEYVNCKTFQNFSRGNFEGFEKKMKTLEELFLLLKSYPINYEDNKGCFYMLSPHKNKMLKNSKMGKMNTQRNKANQMKLSKLMSKQFRNDFFYLDRIFIPKDAFFCIKNSENITFKNKSNQTFPIHRALLNDLTDEPNEQAIFQIYYSETPNYHLDYSRFLQKKRIQSKIRKLKECILFKYRFCSMTDFYETLLLYKKEMKQKNYKPDDKHAFDLVKRLYDQYINSVSRNGGDNKECNANMKKCSSVENYQKEVFSPSKKYSTNIKSKEKSYGLQRTVREKYAKNDNIVRSVSYASRTKSTHLKDLSKPTVHQGNKKCINIVEGSSLAKWNKIDESSEIYDNFFKMKNVNKKMKKINYEIFKSFLENLEKIKGLPKFIGLDECFIGICLCDPDAPKHLLSQKKILPRKVNFNGFINCMRYIPYIAPDYPVPTVFFSSLYKTPEIFNSRNAYINILKYKGDNREKVQMRDKIVADLIKIFVLISWSFGVPTGKFHSFVQMPENQTVDMVPSSYYKNYVYCLRKKKKKKKKKKEQKEEKKEEKKEGYLLHSKVKGENNETIDIDKKNGKEENENESRSEDDDDEDEDDNCSSIFESDISIKYDEKSLTCDDEKDLLKKKEGTNEKSEKGKMETETHMNNGIEDDNNGNIKWTPDRTLNITSESVAEKWKTNKKDETFFLEKKRMSYKMIPKWHMSNDIFLSRLVSYDEIQIALSEIYPLYMIQTALIYMTHVSCCFLKNEEWNYFFESPFSLYQKLTPEEIALRYINKKGHKFHKLKNINLGKNIDIHDIFMNIPENMICPEINKLALNGCNVTNGFSAEPFDIYHLMFISRVFWNIFQYADNFLILRSTLF